MRAITRLESSVYRFAGTEHTVWGLVQAAAGPRTHLAPVQSQTELPSWKCAA